MPVATPKPVIAIDGNFSDWIASERIDYGDVTGFSLFAQAQGNSFNFALFGNVPIGANTTFWLNTDLNASTGYQVFGFAGGAEYNINIKADGTAALYTGGAGETLVLDNIPIAYSADHQSIEFSIPKTAIGDPGAIDVLYDVNDATFGPSNYSAQPYIAANDEVLRTPTHRIAIVYSDTSAGRYFSPTAYSDLFMAAQNQARMAGVEYDLLDESKLTDVNNLTSYDALLFPGMTNVNTAQLPAIVSALNSAVYKYHIGIIAAGDFLTNDQNGTPLAGDSYANMENLLGLSRYAGGDGGNVTVTVNDASNPIMAGYTAGQVIHSYSSLGYAAYQDKVTPADVLVDQNVAGVGTLPGVVQTTTGGTNVHFASASLLGDSNLLSNAIRGIVLGTQPTVALHTSRQAGILAARMDMDQSQFPADVTPVDANGAPVPGIYDTLIPILQGWKQQYNFTGSYYFNIGNNPTGTDPTTTDWSNPKILSYYQAIQSLGGEIGNHSYTHLINPPATTIQETTTADTPAGSTQVSLAAVPSFSGATVGMIVTGPNIGFNTIVTAVSGNTLTLSYMPGGFGTPNLGVLGDIPAGSTLTFAIPPENTNFLEPGTGTVLSSIGAPFTYDYEFNQSKAILESHLGTTIYGAAIPGANETYQTDQNILPYYQSVAAGPGTPGYTGYLTGGWTGIGSGYPGVIGYMSPGQQGTVYIAPNITFDFTEIGYQGKTPAQALADWTAQLDSIMANAGGTPVAVWPIHDYGAAAWNTDTDSATGSPYTTQMFTDFIAQAAAKNFEFVTLEDLAQRTAAQEKATVTSTTSGNTISVTVTPDPTVPKLGGMALSVVNGGGQVIQNVANWYAYNSQEIFLPDNGGSFSINLGSTQDDVTHIASLPMRGDLLSVTGNGLDLSFSMLGDGNVLIDLGQTGGKSPIVTGATIASLVGDQLQLSLTGLGRHDVTLQMIAPPAAPSIPDLIAASDSGRSSSDNITKVTLPTFKGTAQAGTTVTLLDGTTSLGSVQASATGTWTIVVSTPLVDGIHNITATAKSSNGLVSAPSAALAVTIDTVALVPSAPDLTVASDRGISNTDNITNLKTPTFTGTAEVGSTVTLADGNLIIGSAIANSTGTWTITSKALADGTHNVSASMTDLAGNISTPSAALTVQIDTSVPAAPTTPDLADASDTGSSNTDNITNDNTPTFTGTAEPGTTVTIYNGATAVGSGVASATGDWTVTTSALANGVRSITAKAADVAGNASVASPALLVTIDTTLATPTRPDLIATSDSGLSTTDNITNVKTPTFTGNAEGGSTVTLYDGTTPVGTGIAVGGVWTITTGTLADGVHSITSKAIDTAGNVSASSTALSVTVDTQAPVAPVFARGSEGTLSGTLAGTGEAGATVTILDGTTSVGTATVGSGGNWSWQFLPGVLVSSLTAIQTDRAGNPGPTGGVAIIGTNLPDALSGTAGNDLLIGGGSSDAFSFGSTFGNDIIADFAVGGAARDVIKFQGNSVLNSFASVQSHTAQVGTAAVITLDPSNTITLNNVSKTSLTTANFSFA